MASIMITFDITNVLRIKKRFQILKCTVILATSDCTYNSTASLQQQLKCPTNIHPI